MMRLILGLIRTGIVTAICLLYFAITLPITGVIIFLSLLVGQLSWVTCYIVRKI